MLPAKNENPSVTAFPVPWAVKLIDRLHALYGAQFLRQWEGLEKNALALAWSDELTGYTGEEIARGLAECKTRPFPPTLPEFLVLCRPPINPEVAFHEAAYCMAQRRRGERGDWTHPAIFHAAVKVGQHDVLTYAYATLKARWHKALSDELARGDWDPIPDATVALPEPRKTEMSDAEAKLAMASLGAGNVLNKTGVDHKAWAKRTLANPKGKSPVVVGMAKRAVGEAA